MTTVAESLTPPVSVVRMVVSYGLLVLLGLACLQVVLPFLDAVVWAGIIVISSWPLVQLIEKRFALSRGAVTGILVLLLLSLLVFPLLMLSLSLADHVSDVRALIESLLSAGLPALPAWVLKVPVLGEQLQEFWQDSAHAIVVIRSKAEPVIRSLAERMLSGGSHLLEVLVKTLLAVVITAALCIKAEAAMGWITTATDRLAGKRGVHLLTLVSRTIRGVMLGIVGIAFIQGLLLAIGLELAGVPGVLLLTMLAIVLALAQIGVILIWLPSVIWLFYQDQHLAAVLLGCWCILITVVEHFMKPLLISQGSGLPLTIVFMGVIGGLLAWGILGIFTGAIVLGVTYTLLQEWIGSEA